MKQHIKFQTAKLAKELGFHFVSEKEFDADGDIHPNYVIESSPRLNTVYASTQSELQTWLRDYHNLIVEVHSQLYPDSSFRYLYKIGGTNEGTGGHKSWEIALEIGLRVALNILKNERKK